jgi:hypothetical protein
MKICERIYKLEKKFMILFWEESKLADPSLRGMDQPI